MAASDLIQWDDTLVTGVDEIDRQHKVLVGLLNEAGANFSEDHDGKLFERICQDLLAYAIYHFETEEVLMARYDYCAVEQEDAEVHIREHREFSVRVVALRADIVAGKAEAKTVLLAFLKAWVLSHIGHTDQRLGEFIRAHSPPLR